MTKYSIAVLGLSALFLLHGCTTVPESKPAPEPEARALTKPPEAIPRPAVIHRLTDTGIEWVTDVSDLKSRHRFQLAQHIVEVNGATRYHGGSVADIGVRARLRAVGLYRDGVIVANAIYIVRSAQPAPVQTGTASKPPNTAASQAAKPAAPYQSVRTPSVSTAPPSSSSKLEKAGVEKTVAKPMRSQSAVRANAEKKAKASTPSVKSSSVAVAKEKAKAAEAATVNPPQAKAGTQPPAAKAPSAAAVMTKPPAAKAQSKLAKAESGIQSPQPGATTPEKEPATTTTPPTGATPTKDFSHLVFDDRILPMSLDHGWTLDRQRDLVDGATRCVLLSPEFAIFDGYYPAKMWLRINPDRAWVKTDSNIDTSYPQQGLRVDGGTLAPFAKELADAQTAYTDGPVLRSIAEGHTLTVALGFWPTWPKTKTQTASIDLTGFANASAALRACSQQQQAARK